MISQVAICVFKKNNYTEEVSSVYGLELAKFQKYSSHPTDVENASRWIIQKVDLDEYRSAREKELQKQALLEQMRAIKDSSMELEIFATLAKSNPVLADLLSKYNALN